MSWGRTTVQLTTHKQRPYRRTWTHGHGGPARDSTRFQRDRGQGTARLDAPSCEELRRCINEQVCWWCGRDGWKSLAGHTFHAHGITAYELREMAGLFRQAMICSPEYSADCAERERRSVTKGAKEHIITIAARRKMKAKKRNMSEAGKESCRERILAVSSSGQRAAASASSAAKHRRPHPCSNPGCHNIVPSAARATCSPDCRMEIRIRTANVSAVTRIANRGNCCGVTGCYLPYSCKGFCQRHATQRRKGLLVFTATYHRDIRLGRHPCNNANCDNVVLAAKVACCSNACFRERMGQVGRERYPKGAAIA